MTSRRLCSVALMLALLAIPVGIAWLTPINMDEFLPYHVLGCWTHPAVEAQLPDFNYCHRFDLSFAGISLPRRAHLAVGVTPSVFYAPVYMLWPHYLSARLTSLISLSLIAFLLADLTGLELLWAFVLVFLNLPLVMQTTADTGPVAFHLVLCLLIPWLWRRSDSPWTAMLIGLLLFLGLEHKPIFIFLIPAIAILCASVRRPRIKQAVLALAVMLCLSAPYFLAQTPRGETYLSYLLQAPQVDESGDILPYLANVENFLHRVLPDGQQYEAHFPELPFSWLSLCYWGVTLLWIAKGLRYADKTYRRRIIACLAATVFLYVIFISVPGGWAGYHVILAMPFLLLAEGYAAKILCAAGRKNVLLAGVPVFLAVTASCFVTLLHIDDERPYSNIFSVQKRISEREFSQKHMLLFANWGFYYLQHLYGPKDQYILSNIHLPRTVDDAQAYAAKENRTLAVIGNHDAEDMVNDVKIFRLQPMQGQNESTRNFWQIWTEP